MGVKSAAAMLTLLLNLLVSLRSLYTPRTYAIQVGGQAGKILVGYAPDAKSHLRSLLPFVNGYVWHISPASPV